MAGLHQSPWSGTDSNFANSPPVPGQSSAQAATIRDAAAHQRTYQGTCIPCRQRKVKCDLGAVDNPHDPPCSRCRREQKDCYFSSTRRKKKGGGTEIEEGEGEDNSVVKAGRKRLRNEQAEDEPRDRPRTPGGSYGRAQPLQRPGPAKPQQYGEEDIKASEQTTAMLQGAEVHGGHDALKVLMEAAGIRGRAASTTSNGRPNYGGMTSGGLPPTTSPILEQVNAAGFTSSAMRRSSTSNNKNTTLIPNEPAIEIVSSDAPGYKAAIKAWSRFRFVRAGWFTAKEGITYVAYFYKYLSPLTPVTLPDFSNLELHERLLEHEPMLVVTVLLVASRHMRLEGPGSVSRPHTIHHKLWRYLQGMVDRVTWGQEQFGGGFCGAGSQPGCDVNPLTRKGLRTLGTVESLMLLTEWHPRAMHFPPDEADDELMAPASPSATSENELTDDGVKGIGGQRMDSWLEPCWRSDRMCWMLLGMAMSLAFEIGVFDKSEWQRHAYNTSGQPMSADELRAYNRRRGHVRDLLLVYVTQTSGRLGLTSMLPRNYSKPEDSDLFDIPQGGHVSIQDKVLQFWLRIAAIMREGNQKMFANKKATRDLIKSGQYRHTLEEFRPLLVQWRKEFEACSVIPKFMRFILAIEYCYCRVYLNALSLQAVAERCANVFPQLNVPQMDLSKPTVSTNGIRTDVPIAPQTLHNLLGDDRVYMNEVRDAACNLLSIVVDGLYPGEYLRHAPVRTYFRIISVAIMLCKSFSLGASGHDINDSLTLMDKTVAALRTCIVDDVHVASRFADLLDVLIQNLKPRLVRISADGRVARSTKQSVRTTPVAGQEAPAPTTNQTHYAQQQYSNLDTAQNNWSYPSSNTLAGFSDSPYDVMGNYSVSVMPPPGFADHSTPMVHTSTHADAAAGYASTFANDNNIEAFDQNFLNGGNDFISNDSTDWFALPLDPLLGLPAGADINQTMYGPEVAGQDMLELLLTNPNASNNGHNNMMQ
ncbi:hypothetical protein AMS68_000357 [Peltaster fructicola]|uniref:Zn(2)-C6 fungal-type domain-containing protein n=1 Tax=Peltaster fructicola TaxID=286661 RepID=A0A6H0XK00_9PEZI|nr:hypothetical protein AMS68_000357 [Peltaster fructicola]